MLFRKGNNADLSQCKQIGILAYSQYAEILDAENWKKLKQILHDDKNIHDLFVNSIPFVCEINKEIVGVIYYFPKGNPTDLYSENDCYIRSLGVHPNYTGLGVAKKLTQMCVDYAIDTGEKHIALHTSEFMDVARNIYEKMGFIRQKEIIRLGKTYWIFTKTL